jgi:hypothetical protein
MQEHESKSTEFSKIWKMLEVVFGEIEFDKISAERKGIDLKGVRSMQDQQFETVVLRH